MPKMSRDELARRLRAATTHSLPEDVRDEHLAAIHTAAHWADASGPVPAARTRWRRPITALVTAATLVAPTGIAVASQSAQPGGSLYDVKLATERLTGILDSDLAARRRVEELRHLLTGDAPDAATLQRAIDRAMDAVASLPADHPLVEDLAAVLVQLPPSTTPPAPEDEPLGTGSGGDDHAREDDRGDRPDEDDDDTDDDYQPEEDDQDDEDSEYDDIDDDTDDDIDDHDTEDDQAEDDTDDEPEGDEPEYDEPEGDEPDD